MDERKYLQEVFEDILGIDIELKEDLGNQVKKVFTRTIKKLEEIIKKEDKMHKAGIDITNFVDPYMVVVENLILLSFGDAMSQLILWYLYDRKNKKGKLVPFHDNDGEEHFIKDEEELWRYIRKLGFK